MTETLTLINLGAKIKKLRKTKNMTQIELSNVCDIEKASMSRLESGHTNPTVFTLYKISKALEVDIAQFFEN